MYDTVSECFNTIKFEDIKGLKYNKVKPYIDHKYHHYVNYFTLKILSDP